MQFTPREKKYRVRDKYTFTFFDFKEVRGWDDENVYAGLGGPQLNTGDAVITERTGLVDSAGVDIYEGDIINYGYTEGHIVEYGTLNYTISDNRDGNQYERQIGYNLGSSFDAYSETIVTGNIFQNPDLIEEPTDS